jgi:hypothetical protein
VWSQTKPCTKEEKDSIFIEEVEQSKSSIKILHAEPLYIDLIRDLGARKGEKEWNVGFELIDDKNYDKYGALVEYEWVPIDRLGLEVELPFSFYYPNAHHHATPGSALNSIKLASQYTFLVSEKINTSMAIGYIHEFELPAFKNYGKAHVLSGNLYNPFFVAAKRWSNNFHTLLYTGPKLIHYFPNNNTEWRYEINTNFHYMISGTRNFVGLEVNKSFYNGDFDMTLRPQMRLALADNLIVGIVTGIPISRENQRFSTFLRLIYEPGH